MSNGYGLWRISLLVACLVTFMAGVGAQQKSAPFDSDISEIKAWHISASCPMLYDNDWMLDTPDDEYLFVKASQGKADLRGLILTKDEWDNGKQYKVADGLTDFRKNLDYARQSGLKTPDVTIGADRLLLRPANGKIEDTQPISSTGTNLIVREARKTTPSKPLLVFVGGPLITVASAYLTDPSIANRMVVLMTDIDGYNGSDAWANYIVATRCKLINFGARRLWWPQRPQTPMMPLDRMKALPHDPMTAELNRLAEGFWERSTRTDKPDRDDGLADGGPVMLVFAPKSWHAVKKVKVTGAWAHEDTNDAIYSYLDASVVDFIAMREEFFTTLRR